MASPKKKNSKKFIDIRARVEDLLRIHAEDIRRNVPKHLSMGVVSEMDFLVLMIEKLTDGDPAKLNQFTVGEDDAVPEPDEDLVAA